MADFNALGAALIAAKDRKAECEAASKEANAEVERCESELWNSLADAEVDKVSVNGYTFSPDLKDYYSVPADHSDAVREIMERLGLGGIYKLTANAQTLQATLRELASKNDDELPADLKALVSVFQKPKVNMRKAAK